MAGSVLFVGVIALVFALVAFVFVAVIVTALVRWSRNNAAAELSVPATVVARRGDTWGGAGDAGASTTYYATFELVSGDRLELPVPGRDFGQLAEGDTGQLTYQGSRFKGFVRDRSRTR